jgi:hypothetical protein
MDGGRAGGWFQSKHGKDGQPGGHAGPAQRGLPGVNTTLTVSTVLVEEPPQQPPTSSEHHQEGQNLVYGAMFRVTLPPPYQNIQKVIPLHQLRNICCSAKGGRGGDGGNGGNGGNGSEGANGRDADCCFSSSNGGDGGDGGPGGQGSNGADGGDGGDVTIVFNHFDAYLAMAIPGAQDPTQTAMVVKGGLGGNPGRHGMGGFGADGGRGGAGYIYSEYKGDEKVYSRREAPGVSGLAGESSLVIHFKFCLQSSA